MGQLTGSTRDWLSLLQLRIPKVYQGAYVPPFLELRKTAERKLVTVIQEARIGGVSTDFETLTSARDRSRLDLSPPR
jgi:transposase-like protein